MTFLFIEGAYFIALSSSLFIAYIFNNNAKRLIYQRRLKNDLRTKTGPLKMDAGKLDVAVEVRK